MDGYREIGRGEWVICSMYGADTIAAAAVAY